MLYHSPQQTIRSIRADSALPLHVHEHSEETVYVLEGSGTLHLADSERAVSAGDLVVVPRNTPHGFTPDPGEVCTVLSLFAPGFREGDRREVELSRD